CPSSTVLRYLFDVWFFISLWLHLRSRRAIWAVCCGIAVGLSLSWVLDTGIYLLIISIIYSVMGLLRPGHGPPRPLAPPRATLGAATPLAAAVWGGARRGALDPEFLRGIFEAIGSYTTGIGCLPFSSLDSEYAAKFTVVAGVYLFVVSKYLVRLMAKEEPS